MLKNIAVNLFITAGLFGYVLLVPLALTSNQAMMRRLGGRRWRMLHRLIYASAAAGVVHYAFMSKIDMRTANPARSAPISSGGAANPRPRRYAPR